MNEVSSAKNKKERLIRAVKLMLNNPHRPENKKETSVQKQWRQLAPREEGWFFAGDFSRSICSLYQTSILRRDLEKKGLIEYHPRSRQNRDKFQLLLRDESKGNRQTWKYVVRLSRSERGLKRSRKEILRSLEGFLRVMTFICSEPGLFEYFRTNKTDYGDAHRYILTYLESRFEIDDEKEKDILTPLNEIYGHAVNLMFDWNKKLLNLDETLDWRDVPKLVRQETEESWWSREEEKKSAPQFKTVKKKFVKYKVRINKKTEVKGRKRVYK
jgi:hypothetical protein